MYFLQYAHSTNSTGEADARPTDEKNSKKRAVSGSTRGQLQKNLKKGILHRLTYFLRR
jgi:hypothetical protein